jgi:hypothetical protein
VPEHWNADAEKLSERVGAEEANFIVSGGCVVGYSGAMGDKLRLDSLEASTSEYWRNGKLSEHTVRTCGKSMRVRTEVQSAVVDAEYGDHAVVWYTDRR